jgi:hypothetical protein
VLVSAAQQRSPGIGNRNRERNRNRSSNAALGLQGRGDLRVQSRQPVRATWYVYADVSYDERAGAASELGLDKYRYG